MSFLFKSTKRKTVDDGAKSKSKRISMLPEQETDIGFAFTRTSKLKSVRATTTTTNVTTETTVKDKHNITTSSQTILKKPVIKDLFADHVRPKTFTDSIVSVKMKSPEKSIRSRRRSSFARRGKRASTIGNGFVALPHPNVKMNEFYKHISPELPEPWRMRQLLIWCMRRVIDNPKNEKYENPQVMKIAKLVQEDVYRNLVDGNIDVSWYSRKDDEHSGRVRFRSHPHNEENRKRIRDLEEQILKLKEENKKWNNIENEVMNGEEKKEKKEEETEETEIDENYLNYLNENEKMILNQLNETTNEVENSISSDLIGLKKWPEFQAELQYKIDTLYDKLYRTKQFDKISNTFTKKVLANLAITLENQEKENYDQKEFIMIPETMDLLRALSVAH